MSKETISVVGLGYIGLPTATLLSLSGLSVIGVDTNAKIVNDINSGHIQTLEKGLTEAVFTTVQNGLFTASIVPQRADTFIIAVPTPFLKKLKDGYCPEPDLSYVSSAVRAISSILEPGNLIILESTCPVGTTEMISKLILELRPDLTTPHTCLNSPSINIAYCPERVLPGKILEELISNDRIIGGLTDHCARRAKSLYKNFVKGNCITTDAKTAEMSKLAENSSRDVQIAFANELSMVCDKLGIDVWEVIKLSNLHPRVSILSPGPGVGGHCIAVDPWFIVSSAPEQSQLIKKSREVNVGKTTWVVEKVMALAEEFPNKKIFCCGLAYKPNVDDLRESPALEIAHRLHKIYGDRVRAIEPFINDDIFQYIAVDKEIDHTDANSIYVLLVAHEIFQNSKPASKWIIDTVGIWTETK